MNNPKTTVPGIFLLVGALCLGVGHFLSKALSGDMAGAIAGIVHDWQSIAAAIAAFSAFAAFGAKDGGA